MGNLHFWGRRWDEGTGSLSLIHWGTEDLSPCPVHRPYTCSFIYSFFLYFIDFSIRLIKFLLYSLLRCSSAHFIVSLCLGCFFFCLHSCISSSPIRLSSYV